MKALTKEKKEKENVLTYLELMNLKNTSLLNFEKFKRKTTKAKKKEVGGRKGVSEEFVVAASIVKDCTRT